MDKRKNKEILDAYLSGDVDPQLGEVVRGWLADKQDDTHVDGAVREHFDTKVVSRKPSRSTYKRLRALERRLGFGEATIVRMPLTKRIPFRVAAVLIPVLFITGAVLFSNGTSPHAEPETVQAEVAAQIPANDPAALPEIKTETEISEPETPETVAPQPEEDQPREAATYNMQFWTGDNGYRSVTLPGNIVALLNGGSRIAYSSDRHEAMVEGEVYFRVAPGGGRTFRVRTESLTVTVTGTEFEVLARRGNGTSSVKLLKGSVAVETDDRTVKLRPSQELILTNPTGAIRLAPVEGEQWWAEPISFEDQTLSRILEIIGIYYGVEISGRELTDDVRYTIKFDKRSSLVEVLDILEQCAPHYGYRREGAGIVVVKK